MSESDTDFELASENTRLMDGHVATSGGGSSGEARGVVVQPDSHPRKSKRRSQAPTAQPTHYTEVSTRHFLLWASGLLFYLKINLLWLFGTFFELPQWSMQIHYNAWILIY